MEETGSVLLLTGQISQDVQEEFPLRFVDSRFASDQKDRRRFSGAFQGSLVFTWSQGPRCHAGGSRQ